MGITQNLGRLAAGLTADASLNIGVGVTPSGTYKFEVGTTSKFTGVATFGSTLSNGTYTYTLPSATGTLALTSALSGYLPLTGGTLTGTLVTNTPLAINLNYAGSVNDIQLGAGTPLRIVNQAYSAVLFQVNNSGSVGINGTPTGTYGTLSVFGGVSIKDDNNAKLEIGRYNGSVTNSYIKLGTNSNSLRFTNATDAADLMTLFNNGNLLLTTSTVSDAGYKLDVNGTGRFNGSSATPITSINTGQREVGIFQTSLNGGYMTFQSSGANTRGYIGNGGGISSLSESTFGIRSESDLVLMSGGNNPRLTIASTGAATFSSSIAAGGEFTSTMGNNTRIFYSGTATTGYQYIGLKNTSGYSLIGVEGSAAGSLQTGNSAYSTVITTVGATDLSLGTNQVERMRITIGGDVVVKGSLANLTLGSSGAEVFFGRNSANYITANGGGGAQIRIISNTNGVVLENGGTSWGSLSDENSKDIIEPITNACYNLSKVRTIIGKYKTDNEDKRRLFLIAQDIEKIYPEAVFKIKNENQEDFLGLNYTDLMPVLVAAIQEQMGIINELKEKMITLESK
jgi:hypothetical protein